METVNLTNVQFKVTLDDYDRFAKATGREPPSDQGWGRGGRPVINISWEEATKYSEWLSEQTGKHYRLPSEAEWEYAARSGGKDEKWSGTSREQELRDFAWYSTNSNRKTQEVGGKKPNGLGFHDVSGNVWELVEDCSHNNYNGAPKDGSAWLEEGAEVIAACVCSAAAPGSTLRCTCDHSHLFHVIQSRDSTVFRLDMINTVNVEVEGSFVGFRCANATSMAMPAGRLVIRQRKQATLPFNKRLTRSVIRPQRCLVFHSY